MPYLLKVLVKFLVIPLTFGKVAWLNCFVVSGGSTDLKNMPTSSSGDVVVEVDCMLLMT